MSQRVLTILLLALMISGGGTYLVYRNMTAHASDGTSAGSVPMVRAARALEIGVLIKDSDLTAGTWSGPVPAGMATKKETLIGRGVIAAIYEGEPIMESRLAAAGAGGGLAATIPTGKRAVAVRVNDIVGVAGFVIPGTRVDVLISGNPPGQTGTGPLVKTILQNIEVLSAGQNYQKDAEGKPVVVPVVNLLVTPEQAETLSLASNETRIQLVLRNPLDTEKAKVPGSQMSHLFGSPEAPQPVAAPRPRAVKAAPKEVERPPEKPAAAPLPPYHIEVINGPSRTEAKFARPQEAKQ
jgi:pilus assembly protein CpaB